jgi:hypothetical protein
MREVWLSSRVHAKSAETLDAAFHPLPIGGSGNTRLSLNHLTAVVNWKVAAPSQRNG